MPEHEGSLERHERSVVLRNHSRRVVACRTGSWNSEGIQEATGRADEEFAATHDFADRGAAILGLGVEFYIHGFGIEIAKEGLHLKEMLAPLFFNGRRAEPQPRPVIFQVALPFEQLNSERALACGTLSEYGSSS